MKTKAKVKQQYAEAGNGELVFNGDGISVWEDKKVLEMDDGDACTTI